MNSGGSPYAQSSGHQAWPFTVVSMFTANMAALAERLKASLERFDLNYALYQVPTVHRSISPRGGDDLNFCKPAFIGRMLKQHETPILYLDADTVIRAAPSKVALFASQPADFAIYNWLADQENALYRPVEASHRFYIFAHSINLFDPEQLFASGAVQFYTDNARPLLRAWWATIDRHPNVPDDQSLDFTFNFVIDRKSLRREWLDKDYCRCAFWPHVQPVIDHPQLPDSTPRDSFPMAARIDLSRVRTQPVRSFFPRDLIFDSQTRNLLRMTSAGPMIVGTVPAVPRFTELSPAL